MIDDENDFDENVSILSALDTMKQKIHTYSSEALCSIVASDRHLKINPQLQVLALQELDKRKANGDDLDFEARIQEKLNSYPKININIGQIQDLFDLAKKSVKI